MEGCEPKWGERIFPKTVNSAFLGTGFETFLRSEGIQELVMAGFTTDHCVSTSASMAENLGFAVTVLTDATATFEHRGPKASFPADLVHAINLASLHGEFARLRATSEIIGSVK
jgi:nicotinamidase-related amidase